MLVHFCGTNIESSIEYRLSVINPNPIFRFCESTFSFSYLPFPYLGTTREIRFLDRILKCRFIEQPF